jgi:hypothetical protein
MLWWTFLGTVVFFSGLSVWGAAQEVRLLQQQAAHREDVQAVERLMAAVMAQKNALGLRDAHNQAAELLRLRQGLSAKSEWLDWLQKGELGQAIGPSKVFTALASVDAQGVWLDHIELSKGGPTLVLKGNALALPMVVNYANQVAERLEDHGPFLALETNQDVFQGDEAGRPKIQLIRFKLY